jgi:hypothetical protein
MSSLSEPLRGKIKAAKADAAMSEAHKQQAAIDFWARTIEAGRQAKAELGTRPTTSIIARSMSRTGNSL